MDEAAAALVPRAYKRPTQSKVRTGTWGSRLSRRATSRPAGHVHHKVYSLRSPLDAPSELVAGRPVSPQFGKGSVTPMQGLLQESTATIAVPTEHETARTRRERLRDTKAPDQCRVCKQEVI